MNNYKKKDERIILERRKIQSDAYQILVWCLLISILIQQFILRVPSSQFVAELLILIGLGIYVTIRHLSLGLDIWDFNSTSNKKKLAFSSVYTAALSAVILFILTGTGNIMKISIFFICFTLFNFIAKSLLYTAFKRKQRQIDEELDSLDSFSE